MSLFRLSNQVPSFFDQFSEPDFFDWSNMHFSSTNTTLPSVNIKEDAECYDVEVAAPGLTKEDFKIELNNDTLTVSSEKNIKRETNEGERFTKREFSYQSFSRSFALPIIVDHERISAKYENGILSITLPKREEEKPKSIKQISIT